MLRHWLTLAPVCCLGACSTFVSYTGTPLPDEQVATLNCYSRYYLVYIESCRFGAIDGRRPEIGEMLTNTAKLLPGTHWVELSFEKYFGGGGGVTDVCAFELDWAPATRYQVQAHSLATAISYWAKHSYPQFYGGTIELAVLQPGGTAEVRTVQGTCQAFGGSFCRRDEDCVPHPDIGCFPHTDAPFGHCGFRDAPEESTGEAKPGGR